MGRCWKILKKKSGKESAQTKEFHYWEKISCAAFLREKISCLFACSPEQKKVLQPPSLPLKSLTLKNKTFSPRLHSQAKIEANV